MNFLQLCNRLRLECAVLGADMTSVASQSGESARMVAWINSAWIDVQNTRQDWGWMRATAAFPTVANRPINTISQIGLTSFGKWARDTFRNYANPVVTMTIASPCVISLDSHNLSVGDTYTPYTTGALPTGITAGTTYYLVSTPTAGTFTVSATANGSAINTTGTQSGIHTMTTNNTTTFAGLKSEIFMPFIEYETWRDGYEYGALRQVQTRPTVIAITPDKSIGLGPFPIDGYTVLGDYYTLPSEMAANADTPSLPTQFHMAIVYRAMMSYGAYEAASEVYDRGLKEFDRLMRRILADRTPEVRTANALA